MRKYGLVKNDIKVSLKRLRTICGIVVLLLVGSLTSVCIPLMMLPMDISKKGLFESFLCNSLWERGLFVGALFLIVAILCVILLVSITQIRKSYKKILSKISDKNLKLDGYSKYFTKY